MKHRLEPGMKIGNVTLIRQIRPARMGRGPDWFIRCACGEEEMQRRDVLTNPKVFHRCRKCFKKSAKAFASLMKLEKTK